MRENQSSSCTSAKCVWKRKAKRNEAAVRLKDLQLSKEEYGKDTKKYPSPHFTLYDPRPTYVLNPAGTTLFDALRTLVPSAGIISWAPVAGETQEIHSPEQLATQVCDDLNVHHWEEVTDDVTLPTVLEMGEVFVQENLAGNPIELSQELCRAFLQSLHFDQEQREMLYQKTIGQGKASLWMLHRAGRITASNVYKICHLRESTNPKATVELLMNYHPTDEANMPAQLEWGHLKEVAAKALYTKKMAANHEDFILLDCGLALSDEYPFLGASPDGLRCCKCCGKSLIEAKAIYSKRNLRPAIAANDKIYFDQGTSKWLLKENTTLFYQIQCQMAVTKVHITDLVIYTNKGILVISVPFDQQFWVGVVAKLEEFYINNMIPEILCGTLRNQMQ